MSFCFVYRGIQLIEREEEVCIFYEKLSIQDSLISNGDVELHSIEEEKRILKIQLAEETRKIQNLRKDIPCKQEMGKHLAILQREVRKDWYWIIIDIVMCTKIEFVL